MNRVVSWIDRLYETFSIYKAVFICPDEAVIGLRDRLRQCDYPCGDAWDDRSIRMLFVGERAWTAAIEPPDMRDVNFVIVLNADDVDIQALMRTTRSVVVRIQCPASFLLV